MLRLNWAQMEEITEGMSLWLVNMSSKCPRAVLLDSGSFLMLSNDNNSEIVWQRFDYPVDTLLPGMKFGGRQKLVDSAAGLFSLQLDPSGAIQGVLTWNDSVQYWESGRPNIQYSSRNDKRRLLHSHY
ncbi:hypothetical protein SUGI_0543890 [Cryptomeria japonica]|nr:hypothetical protein SUGI_0543890 [Cryptomeria japonica]